MTNKQTDWVHFAACVLLVATMLPPIRPTAEVFP
jgi:hypothetical protein